MTELSMIDVAVLYILLFLVLSSLWKIMAIEEKIKRLLKEADEDE